MEHYNEFCSFIEKALSGLNVQISGNACNIGFVDAGDQIAINILYSCSIKVMEPGVIPDPSDSVSAFIQLRNSLEPRLISSTFKLEAMDYIHFENTAVGNDNRWQLRFRRH